MLIPNQTMGDVWPAVQPGRSDDEYGGVVLDRGEACEVWSLQTFTLTYTVGKFGLDDTGGVRVYHRWLYDGGRLQTTEPAGLNYITARSSTGVSLGLYVEPFGMRPWSVVLRVVVENGFLREGDTITIVYGDTSGGSPGFRMQSYCESAFEFRVAVDACATDQFRPLPQRPFVPVTPGPVARWRVIAPSMRGPNEPFAIGSKAEDAGGNPTDPVEGKFRLAADGPIIGLPEAITWRDGARAQRLEDLTIETPGAYRVTLLDAEGAPLATSNPIVIQAAPLGSFWGDLHGQSGESVGVNPIDAYFEFARDLGFLDVTGHQANDFQVKEAFWEQINEATARFDQDGAFVVFPGYEWSANTAVGGDHNVFFRHEGRKMRRSSHAMLEDRTDLALDANNSAELFEALAEEDCVLYAHVGGRPADVAYAHDPELRTAVEVHSDWGTFEWILTDSLALGHRVGLVCNSDGHKGRPGASYPGASSFGAYGGLTCFRAEYLTRDGIFEAMRRRRHYGTTGSRLHLDVRARFEDDARLFLRDPRYVDVAPIPTREAMMGDIVETDQDQVEIELTIVAQAAIERVDVLNGADVVQTLRPYSASDLGDRVRLYWEGAEHRGRGRQTYWRGEAHVGGAQMKAMTKINAWNPARQIELTGAAMVRFDAITTGNFGGVDLQLDTIANATIDIQTEHVSGSADLGELGIEDHCFEAGGLGRRLRLRRLPDELVQLDLAQTVAVTLNERGDTPIWVRVITTDGHVAWSSPIYLSKDAAKTT